MVIKLAAAYDRYASDRSFHYFTSQKPPVTWDWVMGFTKRGKLEPSSSASSSAFVMAWLRSSSVAYTRFARSFLLEPYVLPPKNNQKQIKISTASTNHQFITDGLPDWGKESVCVPSNLPSEILNLLQAQKTHTLRNLCAFLDQFGLTTVNL
jgi:hypothetical protein